MKKKSFTIKYPKLLLFIITILLAVFLFNIGRNNVPMHNFLISLGYFGIFITGFLYAYGFTSAPATAVLLIFAGVQNIFLASFIASIGALLGDFFIFGLIRYSFMDEIKKLKHERIIKLIEKEERFLFGKYYKYIFPSLAGFLIASPLPTEIGVAMLASNKKISLKRFAIISYLLHSIGIICIMIIGSAL